MKLKSIDLKKVDLKSIEDQEYYTSEDIIIPKGSRIENWSNKQKESIEGRFELLVGIRKNETVSIKISPQRLQDIIVSEPDFFMQECKNKPCCGDTENCKK